MTGAIQADAQYGTTDNGLDDGSDAFLRLFQDAAEPSDDEVKKKVASNEGDTEETPKKPDASAEKPEDEVEEEDSEETEEDAEDDDAEDKDKPRKVLDEDAVVTVKVGEEELAVPVKDLKRLYGQEKALTQKSMEVAEKRKELEDHGSKHVAATEALLTRAQERFKPYANIDWAIAAKELDTEDYKALRGEAERHYQDVQFLSQELDGYMNYVTQARNKELVAEAQATLKELSDPAKGIPNFNEALYNDIRSFAVAQGMPETAVNQIVSAPALRLIHKAMLYDKGQKATTKPVDKKPKKLVKSKSNSDTQRATFNKPQVKQSGVLSSTDATADAFLSMFADK